MNISPIRYIKILIVSILLAATAACTSQVVKIDPALTSLDSLIELRPLFRARKGERVEAQLAALERAREPRERIAVLEQLYREYYNYDVDSAYHYARLMLAQAERYGDAARVNAARVCVARTVVDGGMYGEAKRLLQMVDTTHLAGAHLGEYYDVYQHCLSIQLTDAIPDDQAAILDTTYRYMRLYLNCLPADSPLRRAREAALLSRTRQHEERLEQLLALYHAGEGNDHERALMAYWIAGSYGLLGEREAQKRYLALAAGDDLRTPVREGMALYELAGLLLEEGDVERANRYINCSMEDASYCNFRSRIQQSAQMVQQIGEAYFQSIDRRRREMGYITVVLSLLGLVLLGSLVVIWVYNRRVRQISASRLEMNNRLRELHDDVASQNRQIRNINSELRDANNIKDRYVGQSLSLCSRYISKTNDYRKHLLRIYKDGDSEDLLRVLRTSNPADEEYKEFLALFDETFLHLFPDFVAHVNARLVPEKRFVLRQPLTLNTELRILALIRLGVTHSVKIAAILNCSVATIHTYRAQLRNAALGDRATFDDEIHRLDLTPGDTGEPCGKTDTKTT